MWFDDWTDIVRVLLVGAAAYLTVIVVLRVSGKRTLAKLNAYDLVVTVAVGSTLATILLNSDVSFLEGAVALALLAALQYAVAFAASRSSVGRRLITARPTVLLAAGRIDDSALAAQRVSVEQVHQAIRASGGGDVGEVAAVVLETDGSLSVVTSAKVGDGSALPGRSHHSRTTSHGSNERTGTMSNAADMLQAYPTSLGRIDAAALVECIDACNDCAQACTACADACLSEQSVAELTKCIRTNLDCADLCATTGRVLSRHTGYDANLTQAVLRACLAACRTCADECGGHAEHHNHCRICAQACRRCEQACSALLEALG